MTESTMQYLVSLPDEAIEKVIRLQKEWGEERDIVILRAIDYIYQSNYKPEKSAGKIAESAASSPAMALLQETLERGNSIHIPSLGITIDPKEIKEK